MTKRVFEADIPDGLHMGRAQDSDGNVGMLFDDEGKLRDHAVFKDITDDADSDDFDYSTEPIPGDAIDEETAEALAAVIAALLIAAPIIYEKASPHVKAFFGEVVAPRFATLKENIKGKVDVVIGRVKRKHKSGDIVEVKPVVVEFGDSQSMLCLPPAEHDEVYLTEQEAQCALIECFVAYSKIQSNLELLQHATIRSSDPAQRTLEGSELISFFKSPESIKRLNEALSDNPELMMQYASLFGKSLGHEIVVDGAFRPIEAEWLIDDGPKENEDDNNENGNSKE